MCGGESIIVNREQRIIEYNDESFKQIEFQDINSTFISSDPKCPIAKFSLAVTKQSTLSLSLFGNTVNMVEVLAGSS